MIQFLITAAIVLVFVFILVLLGSGMLWVVVKVFLCPLCFDRNRGYTNIPPAFAVAVFTHGKGLSANLVPVAP